MDANQLDQLSISFPCPDCSGEINKTLEWIKDNNKYWCPLCHVEINLGGKATRQAVGGITRALRQIQRAVLDFQLSIKD